MTDIAYLNMPTRKIFCQHNNERKLCKLYGLKCKRSDIKPASSAMCSIPYDYKKHQRHEQYCIYSSRNSATPQETPVYEGGSKEDRHTNHYPYHLFDHQWVNSLKRVHCQQTKT